jgi:hypothetical protein
MTSTHHSLIAAALVAVALPVVPRATLGARTRSEQSNLRITVIGCVGTWKPAAPAEGTEPPAGSPVYVLSNITLASDERSADTAGAQTKAALLAASIKRYRLDDAGKAGVASHVGDRVEVTGSIDAVPPATTGTTGTVQRDRDDAAMPTLRVEALRTIARDSDVCNR